MLAGRTLRTLNLGVAQGPCGTLSTRVALLRGLRFRRSLSELDVRVDQSPISTTLLTQHAILHMFVTTPVIARARRVRQAQVMSNQFHDAQEAPAS